VTAPVWMAALPHLRTPINDRHGESELTPVIAGDSVVTSERGAGVPGDFTGTSESQVSGAGHPGGVLIMKTIFSKLLRLEKCGQRHNWRGEPVIVHNAEVRAPERVWRAVCGTAPGASTLSLCNANFSKLS
jgi:hypothetical protein